MKTREELIEQIDKILNDGGEVIFILGKIKMHKISSYSWFINTKTIEEDMMLIGELHHIQNCITENNIKR